MHSFPYKKRKIIDEKLTISQSSKSPMDKDFDGKVAKLRQDKRVETCGNITEATKRPDAVSLIHDGCHILTAFHIRLFLDGINEFRYTVTSDICLFGS